MVFIRYTAFKLECLAWASELMASEKSVEFFGGSIYVPLCLQEIESVAWAFELEIPQKPVGSTKQTQWSR